MFRKVFLLVTVNALMAVALFGQGGTATISGQVIDPSGAAIPNALVSILNTGTGVSRSTRSNAEGLYSVPDLIPGNYSVNAEAPGMRRLVRSGIVLRVGDHLTIGLTMQVGSQTQYVTVTGQAPLLRTADNQSGLVVDRQRIAELPQYNRNPLAFALLAPNVNNVTSVQVGHNNDFRINGGRTSESEVYIDGMPTTTGYLHNVPVGVPGEAAVSEFKVITNGLSAKYGRLSGGAITMVTRSGTNNFHGSVYEYFQNQVLNASDWNTNRFSSKKGTFHNNIFGFALGGPVLLPKIYNGHNKTFFFLNYEGTRYHTGSNAVTLGVPTALERQGDFSQTLNQPGTAIVTVSDPLTGVMTAQGVVRQPFPNDVIPTDRWNPVSKIYLGMYPEPNRPPQAGTTHGQNWIGSQSNVTTDDRWTGRLDENWNNSNTTHFTWINFNSSNGQTPLFDMYPYSFGTSNGFTAILEHDYTLNPTTVLTFRAGVVRNVITSGSAVTADSSGWGLSPLMLDLLGTTTNRVPSIGISNDTIAGLGGGSTNDSYETDYTFAVSAQKLMGKQDLQFGVEHRRYYANVPSGGNLNIGTGPEVTAANYTDPLTTGSGLASFLLGYGTGGSGTAFGGPASLQTYYGAYAQDDIKLTSKLTLNLGVRWDYEPPRTERYNRQIWWDKNYKWPVTPTAGWSWAQVEAAAGVTNAPEPSWLTNGYELGRVAVLGTPQYPGRVAQENYPYHFAPRLGFAWQFLPKTVLRGGYGINWLTSTGGSFLNGAPWNLTYADSGRFLQGGTPDNGLTFPDTFNNPMPGGVGFVPNPFATRNSTTETTVNNELVGNWFIANAWNQYPGYEHIMELDLQRQIGSGQNAWILEASANGNLGRDLPFWLGNGEHILPNAYHILGPYGYTTLYTPVPNPIYGQIPATVGTGPATLPFGRMYSQEPFWFEVWTMGEPLGTSNYFSGYFQIQHRFGHGFSFLANYTVSKLLQDVGGIDNQFDQGPSQQGFPQAGLGMGDIYGVAPTDVADRFLFNYWWDVPVGRGRRFLGSPSGVGGAFLNGALGGWRVAGTTTIRGGTPIMVYTPGGGVGLPGSNWYNLGMGRTTRPDIVPGQPFGMTTNGHAALQGSANFQPYINSKAFREPQGMEIGNVPSTFPNWRGPGFSQWDLAVMKNFPLFSEHRTLQFRFESQNLFNHMNAGNPVGSVGNPYFGMITSQMGNPRLIMIAAKILF